MTEKKKTGFEALAKASMIPQEQLLEVKRRRHSFFIGLPREISLQENRISLTPDAVAILVNNGHEVWVETRAGIGSKFTDKQFSDAGAKIVYSPQEVYQANVVLKIEPPTMKEIELMHGGQTLISALQIGNLLVESLQAMLKNKTQRLLRLWKTSGWMPMYALAKCRQSVILLLGVFEYAIWQGVYPRGLLRTPTRFDWRRNRRGIRLSCSVGSSAEGQVLIISYIAEASP